MDDMKGKEVYDIFKTCAGLGTPGLAVFGIFAVALGAFYIFRASEKFEKQVAQADTDTANAASGAQGSLDSTDQGGDDFLGSFQTE